MKKRDTLLRSLTLGLLVILTLASVARELRFAQLQRRHDELQTRIVDQIRATADVVEALQNTLAGGGISALREPERRGGPDSAEALPDEAFSPRDPIAFFRAVDVLIGAEKRRQQAAHREALLEDPRFMQTLATTGLEVEQSEENRIVLARGNRRFFSITLDPESIEISTVHGQSIREPQFGPVSAAFLTTEAGTIERHMRRIEPRIDYLRSASERRDVRTIVEQRNIRVSHEGNNQSRETVRFSSADLTQTVELSLDLQSGQLSINRRATGDTEEAHEILLHALQQITAISDEEVVIHRSRRELEQMIGDNGFQSLLAARGLRIHESVREAPHFIYFDIYRGSQDHVGAFGIQRTTGDIWIMDQGDVPIMSLRRLSGGVSATSDELRIPASLTTDFQPVERSGLTVLLLGANEGVADSIMLAHVDPSQHRIHFFSIPRDLFYRGARINSIHQRFGTGRMATEIGRITGLTVDHYVKVDMYAFIDVINILGGVTVTMEEELVDPTYRVRENGVWGTLYYPPGRHHLDGVAALRIARSRFTTTDFGRARRQQDIVDAMRAKVAALGLRDVATLYALVNRVMSYVETDLSAVDIVRYVQQYARYRNTSHHVLSTDNVLFATYSGLHYSGKTEDEVDADFDLGAWILLPHEENWDLIAWFVERAIEDGSVDLEKHLSVGHVSSLAY
ncbi:MAG: LytR family transcriptional regulator [Spirochaetaceae bacterium]|nr:MAG: LytR family transcriptional regulator [Spirochaetaceae bacterium]